MLICASDLLLMTKWMDFNSARISYIWSDVFLVQMDLRLRTCYNTKHSMKI